MRQSWKGPGRTGQSFVYFAKKICHQFPETSATGGYFVKAYQILSEVKSDGFVNLHAMIMMI